MRTSLRFGTEDHRHEGSHTDRTKYPELTREASADREEYDWGAYLGAGESRAEEMMKICGAMGACLSRFHLLCLSVRHREMQSTLLLFGSVVMWYDLQEQKIKH